MVVQQSHEKRRVSTYFGLGATQPFLDFADVDIDGDLPVFLDPTALLAFNTPWANECVALIQDFFQHILALIASNQGLLAQGLMSALREPNETHLGFSKYQARGRGLGPTSAGWLVEALQESRAVNTGLLEHLEDTILMVEGVGGDLVSDIATNLIREPLLAYTEEQCLTWGIPLQSGVASGPIWDPATHNWVPQLVTQPLVPDGPLLLVPKVLVRRTLEYNVDDYYRYYLMPYLIESEIEQKTGLVRTVKSLPTVLKKDLEAKYGHGKQAVVAITRAHPELLETYRADKREQRRIRQPALTHDQVATVGGGERPDLDALLAVATSLKPGNEDASAYHDAVFRLLTVLFYPDLAHAVKEQPLHGDLKRIDVTFDNVATSGFFRWLSQNQAAGIVFVECKNYGAELGNPELDQLVGRFGPSRGEFGLIVCRSLEDPERFYKRCQNTFDDKKGAVLALTDEDLRTLVAAARASGGGEAKFDLLRRRYKRLLLRAEEPDPPERTNTAQADGASTPEEAHIP
jgi:hypothetical protein